MKKSKIFVLPKLDHNGTSKMADQVFKVFSSEKLSSFTRVIRSWIASSSQSAMLVSKGGRAGQLTRIVNTPTQFETGQM